MILKRLIPVLLLNENGLVKTIKFKKPVYVGDPINAVKIFNEKEVDELIFLDIKATKNNTIDLNLIKYIANECFMPFTYGGGINNTDTIRSILRAGAEKVSINQAAVKNPDLISNASKIFGTQSIVVSIDIKKPIFSDRYKVFISNGTINTGIDPLEFASSIDKKGAGELLINFISLDGTKSGYDIDFIKKISEEVSIPIIASGGASSIKNLFEVIKYANAAAAGSLFVFHENRDSVLINYPTQKQIAKFEKQIV